MLEELDGADMNDCVESKLGAWEYTRDAKSGQVTLHFFTPTAEDAVISIPITQKEFDDLETIFDNVRKHVSKLEIERKYLLTKLPHAVPDAVILINQYYGESDGRTFRIRQSLTSGANFGSNGITHTYTEKKFKAPGIFEELERTIPADEFLDYRESCNRIIRKTRYVYNIDGDIKWEVDYYHDLNMTTAEVELPYIDYDFTIEQYMKDVIDKEVTGDGSFSNSNLAKHQDCVYQQIPKPEPPPIRIMKEGEKPKDKI